MGDLADFAAKQPLRVLSLGGGTQSCALALMSAAGELPKLDAIVFADTHGELPETYEYLHYLRSVVEPAGIPLYVVSAGSLELAILAETPTSANPSPPAHVLNPNGTKGRLGQYRCSYDFKRRQIDRKVKQLCGGRGEWKRSNVEQWIGFSADEVKRMKQSEDCRCGHKRVVRGKSGFVQIHTAEGCSRCACTGFDRWQTNRWPLIELGMHRQATIQWFSDNGHPAPARSACWFCPNSSDERWRALRKQHPDLWERACILDETSREDAVFHRRGKIPFEGKVFWHAQLVPLRDADLRTQLERERDHGISRLFDEDEIGSRCDESGVCFT